MGESEHWDPNMTNDEWHDAIMARSQHSQLLLAIDYDDRLETDFGDGGGLFVGVPADHFARGEFSQVDGITQSG